MDKRKKGLIFAAIGVIVIIVLLSGIGLGLFLKEFISGKEPILKKPSDEDSTKVLFADSIA